MGKENSDSRQSKRENVVDVCTAKQEDPKSFACEPESAPITKESTEKSIEATDANKSNQNKKKTEVANVYQVEKSETKQITDVCNNDVTVQNGIKTKSINTAENEALKEEQPVQKELQSEERNVQQTNSEENVEMTKDDVENVAENKSSDIEKAESDADSQKEEQTNNSQNSDSTEGDEQHEQEKR